MKRLEEIKGLLAINNGQFPFLSSRFVALMIGRLLKTFLTIPVYPLLYTISLIGRNKE